MTTNMKTIVEAYTTSRHAALSIVADKNRLIVSSGILPSANVRVAMVLPPQALLSLGLHLINQVPFSKLCENPAFQQLVDMYNAAYPEEE